MHDPVIAYYQRADGVFERHEMARVDYKEAIALCRGGRPERFDARECLAWALEPPPAGATIIDMCPPGPAMDARLPWAAPPVQPR